MRRYRPLVLYAAVVISLSLAWHFSSVDYDDVPRLLTLLEGRVKAHPVETAVVFGMVSAFLAYFSFPAMPLIYIAAGYCLGALYGGLSVLLGSACGGFGSFLLYRKYIPARFRRPSAATRPVRIWMTLLGLRLSPVVPAPFVNCFAVFLEASSVQFLLTTILGSAPLILFYETVGHQGRGLLHGVQMEWKQIALYAAVLLISTLLSLLGPWRSFLTVVRHVKDDVFAAMARKAAPDLTSAPAAVRTGKRSRSVVTRS